VNETQKKKQTNKNKKKTKPNQKGDGIRRNESNNNLAIFCKLQQLLQFDHVKNNIPSTKQHVIQASCSSTAGNEKLKQSTAAQPRLSLVNPIPDVQNRKPRLLLDPGELACLPAQTQRDRERERESVKCRGLVTD
jgi:hypothetical protein